MGKLAAVPLLLKAGMTVEQIAEQLQVDLAAVELFKHPLRYDRISSLPVLRSHL